MRRDAYVFVVWGDAFEEMAASIFVVQLRAAGLPVKLVSLSQHRSPGTHGLVLLPDWTLEQALPFAGTARGIVVPCGAPGMHEVKDDPRLLAFCQQALDNHALLIVGGLDLSRLILPEQIATCTHRILRYPEGEDLIAFVRALGPLLLNYR